MRYRNLPVVLAAAAALAVLPAISATAGFGGAAQAGAHGGHAGGHGGGPGGPGGDVGTASSHASHGMDTAAAAVSPETSGLGKAGAVLETTPASDEAKDAVDAAIAEQENDVSFGAALDNMASDVRGLLAEVFGNGGGAE